MSVQPPHVIHIGFVSLQRVDATQEIDLVVAVRDDSTAVEWFLALVEAGCRNLAVHVLGEVDGLE